MINPNAILEINSKNLIKNYKTISKYSNKSLAGAVIKANAYGLGDIEIYKKLYKAGCRNFFLATLNEAINIRKKYLSSNLYVLNGLENNKISNLSEFTDIFLEPCHLSKMISKYIVLVKMQNHIL